ncbi:hypothetical protein, partial [Pandoraea terrae]|uniref:nSTAND3 domain-containing NTPase n=1 Tax=Pandoraea terrae TaxID=1537710 RepID=UPI00124273F1
MTKSSTIQCKFTSNSNSKLTLPMLTDELGKVSRLVQQGLAEDYVLITNHFVSGAAEANIVMAFKKAGATQCRVLSADWLIDQIEQSARLRMLVPRLYGLGDLSNILDERAYEQASMILSSMGNDLKKLVVTEAHRRSVEAINRHGFVLLLGAPASGKSTIGASLAVGAADLWGCLTLKPTSPAELRDRINPNEKQFFWIDDAWGATQFQRSSMDVWNQVLPLIAGALHNGSKFLITSRTYIWSAAKDGLKLGALPLLTKSSVTIHVEKLTADEKAQILYNHLKFGDQGTGFRRKVKTFLPQVAANEHFLPESARRLGSSLLSNGITLTSRGVLDFFEKPSDFLLETVRSLESPNKAALAFLFVSSGKTPSPILDGTELSLASQAFGVSSSAIRNSLNELDETLVLRAHDTNGAYWRFKHPTIAEAFGRLVAQNPELVELYLTGAKPEWLMSEVVCSGMHVKGALVVVPPTYYPLLAKRLAVCDSSSLRSFLSLRASADFSRKLIELRPTLIAEKFSYYRRIADEVGAHFLARMYEFGLLPEENRLTFVKALHDAAIKEADSSVVEKDYLRNILTADEIEELWSNI